MVATILNPFSPTLGKTPPLLVGRASVLADIDDALASGPGAHERVSVITGMRGIGKTVMLNVIEERARQHYGWLVYAETGTQGFLQRLTDAVVRDLLRRSDESRTRLVQVGAFGVSIGVERVVPSAPSLDLRTALTLLLDDLDSEADRLHQEASGVMITLDELHHMRQDEIRQLAATVQHLIREDRNISLMMAGIPSSVRPLLASEGGTNPITFLRRANQIELGPVGDDDVAEALREPVLQAGMEWDEAALGVAVEACGGYPFMIQLVGRWCLRFSDEAVVSVDDAQRGVMKARTKLGSLVHGPALDDLSDVDRTFLAAMAVDDGPSRVADLAERMGVDANYVNQYRRRLIDAQMIEPVGRGTVSFSLPYLRDYLREHGVSGGVLGVAPELGG